ncbi:MAG: hypothetical protein Q7S84_01655 [bacterium]|nr:hypothetical protein [bacterium]
MSIKTRRASDEALVYNKPIVKLNISRKAIYYGLGGGLVVVLAAVAFKLFTPAAPPVQVAPNQFVNVSAIERGVQDCATYVRVSEGIGPSAYLCIKENRDLVVRWQDFPRETATTVTIYRAEAGSETLEVWQTLTVTGASGETVLQTNLSPDDIGPLAGGGGGIGGITFYIEATSPTGTLIFASAPPAGGSTATSTSTSTQPTATSTTTSTPTSTPVVIPPPIVTPPPAPIPTSTPTSTVPTTTSTATSTGTSTSTPPGVIVYYYSPSGAVTGQATITEPQSNFWVQHVNQKIELGWYSLPPETTKMTVSRSATTNGPWLALLTQGNPVTTYYQLYLVDSTVGTTHYYKLETYNGETKTATYGPVELAPE